MYKNSHQTIGKKSVTQKKCGQRQELAIHGKGVEETVRETPSVCSRDDFKQGRAVCMLPPRPKRLMSRSVAGEWGLGPSKNVVLTL